jgi:superfamily II RNA helicase
VNVFIEFGFLGTIHSKFGPVFGIFTGDYKMNLQTCRILVTVPDCLEMLLLSPNHQRWCQRIRYCIFDEIHCMSGDIGSDVWERTMLLINCPMIGLSATVNNGQNLTEWIGNIEKQRASLFKTSEPRQVQFISHHERLADLNKYLYSNRQLHPLHPVGLMNAKQLVSRGVPEDFSLSPNETLRLNEAIQKHGAAKNQVPTLTEYFSPGWIVERSVCNTYSRLVCKEFNELINRKENSTIDSISASLNPTISNNLHYPELKPMSSLIGEFVLTLKEKNLLPCIVFTDSRSLCEELAESVAQYFEELENELRRTKYKHQIEALEKRLAQIEKAQKSAKAKKVVKVVKATSKRGDEEETPTDKPGELQQMEEEDQSQLRLSGYEQDLLNGILEEGTLANRRGCDRELVDRLLERAATANPRLVRYIKRGVAYHHSQLNNRGRLAVEGLFRNRYVQIVFSTWTLGMSDILRKKNGFSLLLFCSFGCSYANENSCFC